MVCSPYDAKPLETAHIEKIAQRLSTRDIAVMGSVHRLRLATRAQLERLHFTDLRPTSRRRVLHRLVSWRILTTLPRRVGALAGGMGTDSEIGAGGAADAFSARNGPPDRGIGD